MANSPKITVNGFKFSWAGGAYIDITAPGQSAPFDVINVQNRITQIDRDLPTQERLTELVNNWIESETEQLRMYAEANPGSVRSIWTVLRDNADANK